MQLPRPVRRRHSIVLTSLVDVMFVLLFFFMLAASATDRRSLAIGLPVSAGAATQAGRELQLDLLSAERWVLQGAEVEPRQLSAQLQVSGATQVRLQVAAGVPVQVLVDALAAVRDSGLAPRLQEVAAP
jgi:biopolymer transport protein ExbD